MFKRFKNFKWVNIHHRFAGDKPKVEDKSKEVEGEANSVGKVGGMAQMPQAKSQEEAIQASFEEAQMEACKNYVQSNPFTIQQSQLGEPNHQQEASGRCDIHSLRHPLNRPPKEESGMSFEKARQKLAKIAGKEFYTIEYRVAHHQNIEGSRPNQCCVVYIDGFNHNKGSSWKEAFEKLHQQMNPAFPQPFDYNKYEAPEGEI